MATKTREQRDIYAEVTDRITAALEEGTVPWRKPWMATDGHHNPVSGTMYRGINPFLLEMSAAASGYTDPRWLTFKQAKTRGAKIRAGEKGTLVTLWKMLRYKVETDDGKERSKSLPLLRHYVVFNVAQVDGLDLEPLEGRECFEPLECAERVMSGMPDAPSLGYGGSRACYAPAMDHVQLPQREAFTSREAFYNTAFHELVHATGHERRLNRREIAELGAFGDEPYSREELVAEMGAAMLCGHCAIFDETADQSAAYIAGWLKALKDDRKLLVTAASRAQRAADFILGRTVAEVK